MMILEDRQRVIDIAKTWLSTPFHHEARVKGAGVDCANFLCAVYHEAGIVPYIQLDRYPIDWHMHRGEERFLIKLLEYTHKVKTPQMADIVMFRFGRCSSHSAIYIEGNTIIHSLSGYGVIMDNFDRLKARITGYFSPWGKP